MESRGRIRLKTSLQLEKSEKFQLIGIFAGLTIYETSLHPFWCFRSPWGPNLHLALGSHQYRVTRRTRTGGGCVGLRVWPDIREMKGDCWHCVPLNTAPEMQLGCWTLPSHCYLCAGWVWKRKSLLPPAARVLGLSNVWSINQLWSF